MRGFPWVKLNTASIEDFGKLPAYSLKVFWLMVKVAQHGGFVHLKREQVQKKLKLSRSTVWRAIGSLVAHSFIEDRGDCFRINPRYVEVGRKAYKPKLPGLVDTTTGVIKKFKVKPIDNAANVHHS